MFSASTTKSVAFGLAAFFLGLDTASAGAQTGQITALRVRSTDGLIIVEMSGPASAKPACAGFPYWLIADEKSNAGKQQLALLMAAQAGGKTVTIDGTGACTRWPDGETIGMVTVHPN